MPGAIHFAFKATARSATGSGRAALTPSANASKRLTGARAHLYACHFPLNMEKE